MHCLIMQDCFMRPGPPNFFMSLQKWHSPHSVRRHASHFRQRVLLRLAPDELRLDGSLTADDDVVPILGLGRLAARCCKTNNESGWRLSANGRGRFIPGKHCISQLIFSELLKHRDNKLHQHNKRMNHLCLSVLTSRSDCSLTITRTSWRNYFWTFCFFIYCDGWNKVVL